MNGLSPEYAAALTEQLAFLSAVLGGFAVTFAGTILSMRSDTRAAGRAFVAATVAAGAFITATAALTGANLVVHPSSPLSKDSLTRLSVIGFSAYTVGLLGLVVAIGLSGWIRSRRTGIATTIVAALSALLVLSSMVDGG